MKNLILILLLGGSLRAYAQTPVADTALRNLTKIDLGFQGVGLSYEPRVGSKTTIDFAAGIGAGTVVSEDRIEQKFYVLAPSFYFGINPKFYYNRQKRIRKGKSVINNAGNYIGARMMFVAGNGSSDSDKRTRNSLLFNIHWGIQRPIGQRWLFNAHAGLGSAVDVGDGFTNVLYPVIGVKFAYLLGLGKR